MRQKRARSKRVFNQKHAYFVRVSDVYTANCVMSDLKISPNAKKVMPNLPPVTTKITKTLGSAFNFAKPEKARASRRTKQQKN